MKFRLRYQQHDLQLSEGEFMIGRSASCQLSLDDPMVSRNHARLLVSADQVTLYDLGSRNGVKVNDQRVTGSRALAHGDVLTVGSQKLTLLVKRDRSAVTQTAARAAPTHRLNTFGILGSLADKAVALGRGDEAERILSAPLAELLESQRAGGETPPEILERAARYAAVLAATTGKASWFDYVIDLYTELGRPCPAEVVDELYSVLRKVGAIDLKLLRRYVELLRSNAASLGPAERFLLNRIEGLERIAALR
jgi:pSer/pThr/pTyr-binding forkhead associated (FHA) protein